jgi:hypothetical protein
VCLPCRRGRRRRADPFGCSFARGRRTASSTVSNCARITLLRYELGASRLLRRLRDADRHGSPHDHQLGPVSRARARAREREPRRRAVVSGVGDALPLGPVLVRVGRTAYGKNVTNLG